MKKYLPTLLVAAFLAAQALLATLVSGGSGTALAVEFGQFPTQLGDGRWSMIREDQLSPGEAQVLRADRVLMRTYRSTTGAVSAPLHLLIAYFESQGHGRAPHSPKNCLPGSGFEPVESSIIQVGGSPVNRYVLARDESRLLMFYWYQSSRRAVASEYQAKLFLVKDALLHQRTETAIVRVSVPLQNAADTRTEEEALAFVAAVQPAFLPHLTK
jgi:EpsI family protein